MALIFDLLLHLVLEGKAEKPTFDMPILSSKANH